jgi:alpha-galactosidase
MKKRVILFWAVLFAVSFSALGQEKQSLALTPPMGWNSWNTFGTHINEKLVKEIADAMVSSGMRDAGYKYIIIDDGWETRTRDAHQDLLADPKKFPHGIKALADYIHSRGLKFGIYNCAGTMTCARYPGARGHEYADAITYASWGVDYLKFDWCYTKDINPQEAYATMSKALKATHRPIVFSLCNWGVDDPWKWAAQDGQLWRISNDIGPGWYIKAIPHKWTPLGITQIIDIDANLRQYAGPGHWNDPDMLEVGNGLTVNEDRAHFSMWAMLAAPLIAGNDLRHMTEETKSILTNKGVIAVDQDSLGIQGLRYAVQDSLETWVKPLEHGKWAVCFLNQASGPEKVDFKWKDHVISDSLSGRVLDAQKARYEIRDLWKDKNMGTTGRALKVTVPSHDVLMVLLSPKKE